MRITRIASTYYVVSDVERATAFCRDVLGLTLRFSDPGRWAQFDVDGAALAMAAPAPGQPPVGSNAVVVLECEDLDAARAHLEARGIACSDTIAMGDHGAFFTITDPDGNCLQLFARARSADG